MSFYYDPDCYPFGTFKFPPWNGGPFQNPNPDPSSGLLGSYPLDLSGRSKVTGSDKEEPPLPSIPLVGGDFGQCLYCLKVGEHPTPACSYIFRVPKNAKVGPLCDLVCTICGDTVEGDCGCCGDEEVRAILNECWHCGEIGDHWDAECPNKGRPDKSAQVAGTKSAGSFESHRSEVMKKFKDYVYKLDEARHRPQLDKSAQLPTSIEHMVTDCIQGWNQTLDLANA